MSNVFYSKFSEVSGERLDPKYNDYITRYQTILNNSVKLGSLLAKKPQYGANESAIEYNDKCRYIRITDIDEFGFLKNSERKSAKIEEDKYKVKINDILIARSGATVGKAYIHKDKSINAIFAGYMIRFSIDESKINPNYIFYYTQLNIYKQWTEAIQRSAGQPNINSEEYQDLDIPLLKKDIQNKIVKKMEKAHQQKQQKEQEAQRKLESIDSYLLKELGVALPKDGDDSLEDRVFFRKFSELKGRFDGVYYSEKFVALEKALSNSNYPLMRLGDICKINRGGSPRPIHDFITDDEDGINWIKIGDTKGIDKYIYKTKQKIIPKGVKHSRMVYEGDFILSNSMSFGRPYIMKTTGCIHDGWLLLRKKENIVSEDFLYSILNSALIYKFFKKETIGGVVENLSIDLVKKIKIPIPPLEIQNKIANNNQKLLNEVESLKKEAKEIYTNAKEEVEKMILGEK